MTLKQLLCSAVILAGLAISGASVAGSPNSQGKSCGQSGAPSCPPPAPAVGPFAYSADPHYGAAAPNTFHSFADIDAWYTGPFTINGGWCSSNQLSNVEGANEWGAVPGYLWGMLVKDSYLMTYNVIAYSTIGQAAPPYCVGQWQSPVDVLLTRTVRCPAPGAVTYSASPLLGPTCSPPSKGAGPSCSVGCGNPGSPGGADSGSSQSTFGNPVNVSNGNKFEIETDYAGTGTNPLKFTRTYNSLPPYFDWGNGLTNLTPPPLLGAGWSATYFQYLAFTAVTDSTTTYSTVWAYRPDGRLIAFNLYNGIYSPDADVADSLMPIANGWEYQTANDTIEIYNTLGQLVSIAMRGQAPLTVSYPAGAAFGTPPASVSDAFGHSLTFSYAADATGVQRLIHATDPAGQQIAYAYDTQGNLATVTYPDTTSRGYAYTTYSNHALTTLTDEASVAYASWTYSPFGDQVLTSQHAGGVDAYTFSYSTGGNPTGTVTVTDPLGKVRTLNQQLVQGVYRTTGASSVCPGCGEDASRIFDSSGNMTSRTDFNSNQTTYIYDTARNLETSRTEAVGTGQARTIGTQWDTNWRRPTLVTEPNRTTAFTYDAMGNVLTKTVKDTATSTTRVWTYTYDGYGRVLTADGPRTDVVDRSTYAYYTCTTGYQCGQLNTVTNAASQVTTYNTYNPHGQPLTITDPNGVVTTLTYDLRQRVTSRQVGTELTTYAYYPTGLLQKVTLPDSSYVQYTYDTAHRLTQIADGAGNSIHYTLDNMGNRTAESSYDPSSVLSRTHARVYNTLNQLYQDIGAANTAAVTTTFGYDTTGNQTSTAAPLSRTTTNQFDALNRLKQVTDPATGVTQYAYDANDNLTQVTDPRTLATTYQYTGFGDVKQLSSPDTGTTNSTYDSGGNLSTSTDARSAISTYTYDAVNRVVTAAFKIGSRTDQTVTYTYDAGTNGTGHLTSAGDANHSMTWAYDGLGRVVSKGQTLGTVTKTAGYAYTNGNLTTLTTPSGQSVVYSYSNGQITGISVNGTSLLTSVVYEPFGPVRGWTWGNAAAEVRLHNTDGDPSQVSAIESSTYGYDNAFRITGITNASNSALSWTYGYDLLDRLTSGSKTGTTQGWTYDANGNRLTQTGTAAGTYTPSSTSNRLNSITGTPARTYTYSASGSTLTYSTTTFTYYNSGRMKTAKVGSSTTTYVYNALGQRIKKSGGTAGTVLMVYDEAGRLLGEYSSTGALVQETVWLGDIPVATIRPGTPAVVYYVHADHLNAPRMVTRPSDNKIAWRWDTDPFGTPAPNENPQSLGTFKFNLRYPGQYFDVETGLSYNYHRDYDPQTGRYLESDPLLHAPAGFMNSPVNSNKFLVKYPQLLSSYNYVFDSPVLGSDRYGLGPIEWLKKLFESKECAQAIAAVRKAAARCDRECPANAELEKQAEFTEKYSDSGDYAKALAGCVCRSMPEVCAKAATCPFGLIY